MTDKSPGEWTYEQFAERYAEHEAHNPYHDLYEKPATWSLLPDITGAHILDAGCGPGIIAADLLDQGAAHITAIDVTPAFIQIATDRLQPYGDRATVIHADLSQPLVFARDQAFDLVLSRLVLHYIDDLDPVFREFYRVLRPGGRVVFSIGHPFEDWRYVSHLIGEHSYFEKRLFEDTWKSWGDPPPVVRSYRRSLMDTLNPLIHAGFHLETVLEPQPLPEFEEVSPTKYARWKMLPNWLCVRGRKLD